MKKFILPLLAVLVTGIIFAFHNSAVQSNQEPWTQKQLMSPAALAAIIKSPAAKKTVLFSIGPAGLIKGAINIGPTQEKENINKLRQQLSKLPKDADIVIYCGCCPFKYCPNIRPAFSLLKEMKFTNAKLLNLPHNLKADWIDHGYPMNK